MKKYLFLNFIDVLSVYGSLRRKIYLEVGAVHTQEKKPDYEGVSSRVRLWQNTFPGLTPAITANVGNSIIQLLQSWKKIEARKISFCLFLSPMLPMLDKMSFLT